MDISKDIEKIKNFSTEVKKNILEMAFTAGASSSHFGGALSIVEIISFLFSHKMKIKKNNPNWIDRDRFILSKGHACLAYYAALCEVGYITKEQLKTFEKDDSDLLGHPVINRKLGIDFSNGSLGMGLSLGIGVAIALKKNINENKLRDCVRVFNNVCSSFIGKQPFYLSTNPGWSSSYNKRGAENGEMIYLEPLSLSKLFQLNNINRVDVLKIDIEGAEYDIILNDDFLNNYHQKLNH